MPGRASIGNRWTGARRTADRTWSDLDAARWNSRRLIEGAEWEDGNEFALGAAENRVNYAVGESGFNDEAVPAPGVAGAEPLARQVQEWIDLVREANDLPGVEAEAVWRLDRDGDALLRIFARPGDVPQVRWVEPERVRPPSDPPPGWPPDGLRHDPDWHWGVVHAPNDRGTVVGYWVEKVPHARGRGFFPHVRRCEVPNLPL